MAVEIVGKIKELDVESEREDKMSEQLECLYNFAKKSGFQDTSYLLLPDEVYTLIDAKKVGSLELPIDLHPVKLFLGADEEYGIWDHLKLLPRSNTKVVFFREHASTGMKQVDIEDASKVILVNPLRVCAKAIGCLHQVHLPKQLRRKH